MNLLEHVKINVSAGGSTIGGGIAASTWLDMSGFDGVLYLLSKSSTHAGSSGTIIVQQSSALSTGAGIFQSTFSNGAHFTTGLESNPVAVDVVRPLKRYVRLRLLTCTGIFVTSLQYMARNEGSTEAKVQLQTISGVHLCSS